MGRIKNKRKKDSKSPVWLKKCGKIGAASLALLSIGYLSAGLLLDSGFFFRDAREKIGQVAGVSTTTTLSVRFIDIPSQPVITATPLCNDGSPYVKIDWNDTSSTDFYSIERDGEPLVTGLESTTYNDTAVQGETSYSYVVTAHGSMGQTSSDPVSVTTPDCTVVIPPSCTITRLDTINLIGYSGTPTIHNQTPILYGTTNIPSAIIDITMLGRTSIIAQTQANVNGYWSWQSPIRLEYGPYISSVTATDPTDITRHGSATLSFEIKKREKEEEKKKKEEITAVPPTTTKTPIEAPKVATQLSLLLTVLNQDKSVFSGQILDTQTDINTTEGFVPEEKELTYKILNPKNEVVWESASHVFISGDQSIEKQIKVPRLLRPGLYKISVETSYNGITINSEDSFTIKERPLVSIGEIRITMTDLLISSGWILIALLFLLIILIILIAIEHWFSKHALAHITEDVLKRKGFIRGKEVFRE